MNYAFHTASNYLGTDYALNGCVNDMKAAIKDVDDYLKIPSENRKIFANKDYTKANITAEAIKLPNIIKPGDMLFYTNSSHGTQIIDEDHDEEDGYDEAMY